jgi:predicted carbohydrate-binding protein with CBM5 and CBM33 domain
MNRRRPKVIVVLLTVASIPACVLVALVTVGPAYAHGSMQVPASRAYTCWQEGPEHPQSAACKAAVAAGGTQALYDWNEIHLLDANGRHRQLIPDGKLCSAGLDKYKGFDLARADWTATTLPVSGNFGFTYKATAPHRGTFELYVTKNGYNPAKPLKWSDLESAPFFKVTDPPLTSGAYTWTAALPKGKSGRHLIYTIWQRSDSPEAFYTCSDVVFGSGGTTTPPPSTCGGLAEWDPVVAYSGGQRVAHKAREWEAKWWTQGEEPGTTGEWGAWADAGAC